VETINEFTGDFQVFNMNFNVNIWFTIIASSTVKGILLWIIVSGASYTFM
jgi:hypothetical protein